MNHLLLQIKKVLLCIVCVCSTVGVEPVASARDHGQDGYNHQGHHKGEIIEDEVIEDEVIEDEVIEGEVSEGGGGSGVTSSLSAIHMIH